MGLRSAGEIKETATVVIKDPATGKPLKNADKSDITVTLYGPYSEHYRKIKREMDRKMAEDERARAGGADLNDLVEEITRETMIRCIADWSMTLDSGPKAEKVAFSVKAAESALAEFPWLYDQLDREFSRVANFLGRPQSD